MATATLAAMAPHLSGGRALRVAVVVPCYNDGETLPDALESLREQEPHELVVVDDGSDDAATLAALAELERTGTHVVRRSNGGLSVARMTGVENTEAPYVMPLDADDALAPGALTALADALDADGAAAVAWGDVDIWGEFDVSVDVGKDLDPWKITYINTVPVASLVRRDALLTVGGWELRHGYEDWDLWMSLAERGFRGLYIPVPTLRYRRRAGRMLEGCLPRHGELYAELRRRHMRLFELRRRNWLTSKEPLRDRMLFPLIACMPLRELDRIRLYGFIDKPAQALRVRRLRRHANPVVAA